MTQDNNVPDNESPNPFRLNLDAVRSSDAPAPVPPESVRPVEIPGAEEPVPLPQESVQPEAVMPQPVVPEEAEPQSIAPIQPQPPQPQPVVMQTERPVSPVRDADLIHDQVMAETKPYTEQEQWMAFLIAIPVLACVLAWTYWSTLVELVHTWNVNIDYHHGFFVAPFVVYFLWCRRDTFPKNRSTIDTALGIVLGSVLLVFWGVFRYYVMVWSMVTLDSWTILVWVWAVCLMCFGMRVFIWALPSLLFLAFMFPWPSRIEILMREPLQVFAARFSVYILWLFKEPAVAQSNIVLMSDNLRLDVAAACSGIRVLVSVIAAAYAAVLLMRRPWWQNALLFCMVVPVALFVNALRIAMTGMLIKHASGLVGSFGFQKATPVVCDEISGMVMLVLTFVFFIVIVWWFGMVFRRVDVSVPQTRIQRGG